MRKEGLSSLPPLFRFSTPRRLRATLTEEESEDHRLDTCFFYENCLTRVAILNWTSFSCSSCRVFLEEKEKAFMDRHPELATETLKFFKK